MRDEFQPDWDAPPPQRPLTDVELERALLALVFADNANLDRIGRLEAEDLTDPVLSAALDTAIALRADGLPISLTAMKRRLGAIKLSDDRTGLDVIRSLTVGSVAPDVVEISARLRFLAERRRLADYLRAIGEALLDEAQPATALAADVSGRANDFLASAISSDRTIFDLNSAAQDFLTGYLSSDAPAVEITTGLTDLDSALGGFHRGEFTILAGRTSMGKSTVATSSMWRTALAGRGVLFFSFEMTKQQIVSRVLADLAYTQPVIAYSDMKPGKLTDGQIARLAKASRKLEQLPLLIETKTGLTVADIIAKSRKTAEDFRAKGWSLDLVIVDHLLKVRPSSRYAGNPVKELDEVSEGMCALAKGLNVAVLGLHQLNRGVEARDNQRPVLSDLRGSGALEQDADNVLFVFRPAYAVERKLAEGNEARAEAEMILKELKHVLEIQIAKQRNGPTTNIELFVDASANAVRDRSFR